MRATEESWEAIRSLDMARLECDPVALGVLRLPPPELAERWVLLDGWVADGMGDLSGERRGLFWRLSFALPQMLLPSLPRSTSRATLRTLRGRFDQFEAGDWAALLAPLELRRSRCSGRVAPPAPEPAHERTRREVGRLLAANERRRAMQRLASFGSYTLRDLTLRLQDLHPPAGATPELAARERDSWAPLLEDVPGTAPFVLTEASWWEAVRTSPRLSSGGPSKRVHEHIQVAWRLQLPGPCAAWHRVAAQTAQGLVPEEAVDAYAAAGVGGLFKDVDRAGLRPIAAGESIRRLVGRAMLRQERARIAEFFLAWGQVGVGLSAGAEAMKAAVELVLDAFDDLGAALLDSRNAFNEMLRSAIFAALREHFPEFLPHVRLAYRAPKRLSVWGRPGEAVLAERGVEQGDVWGPFLFALGLVLVLSRGRDWLAARGLLGLLVALMDDLAVVAALEPLAELLPVLSAALAEVGLTLTFRKTHLLFRGGLPAGLVAALSGPTGVARFHCVDDGGLAVPRGEGDGEAGARVVGFPVGSERYMREWLARLVNDKKSLLDLVDALQSFQDEQLLVRSCVHATLVHAARGCPRGVWEDAVVPFDAAIRSCVERWAQLRPGEQGPEPHQVEAPLRWGGLALRKLAGLGPAARVGALAGILHVLSRLSPLLAAVWEVGAAALAAALAEEPPRADSAQPPVRPSRVPRALRDLVADVVELRAGLAEAHDTVRAAADASRGFGPTLAEDLLPELRAWPELTCALLYEGGGGGFLQHRLTRALELGEACRRFFAGPGPSSAADAAAAVAALAGIGAEGGLWLDQPCEDGATRLSNSAFATALRLRWGLPLWPWPVAPWECHCAYCREGGASADPSVRALACKKDGWLQRRHDGLQDCILAIGVEAGCGPAWRTPTLRRLGLAGRRGDGRLDGALLRGPAGRAVCFDVRVTDPRGATRIPLALRRWGGAARDAVAEKDRKYGRIVRDLGWDFAALVWEAHGFASEPVGRLLGALASHKFPTGLPGAEIARSQVLRRWRCRLALRLQVGNAACALARGGAQEVPGDPGPLWPVSGEGLLDGPPPSPPSSRASSPGGSGAGPAVGASALALPLGAGLPILGQASWSAVSSAPPSLSPAADGSLTLPSSRGGTA